MDNVGNIEGVAYNKLFCTDGNAMIIAPNKWTYHRDTNDKFVNNIRTASTGEIDISSRRIQIIGTPLKISDDENVARISFESCDPTFKSYDKNHFLVGPFKVDYNGNIDEVIVYQGYEDDEGTPFDTELSEDKYKLTNEEGEEISITTNTEFYIKVEKDIKWISNIKIKVSTSNEWRYRFRYRVIERWVTEGSINDGIYASNGESKPQVLGRVVTGGTIDETKEENDLLEVAFKNEAIFQEITYAEVEIPGPRFQPGDLKITKVDYDTGRAIPGVTFKITGNDIDETITTDKNGVAELKDILEEGTYRVEETGLPDGYDLELQTDTVHENVAITAGITTELEIKNRKYGNLIIKKVDKDTQTSNLEDIKFEGVKFRISYTDENNKVQYITSYTEGKPSKLTTSENKNNAYLFTTDKNAIIELKDIPQSYTYHVEEVELPLEIAQYYEVSSETLNVTLKNNVGSKDTEIKFNNPQRYVDLEGDVWEDIASVKLPSRNNIWKENSDDNNDKGVPNIPVYLKKNSTVIATTKTNEEGHYFFPAKGMGVNGQNYTINIKEASQYSVEFEYNGLKYENVLTYKELEEQFNIKANQEKTSKASESRRDIVNNNFSTIYGATPKDKNNWSSTGKTSTDIGLTYTGIAENVNDLNDGYNSKLVQNTGYTSETLNGSIRNVEAGTMLADTATAGYIIEWQPGVKTVRNINLGIYERSQPDMAIVTDIDNIRLDINGYSHTYGYEQRDEYLEGGIVNSAYETLMDGFSVLAKRNGAYREMTYVREVYDSYIAYTKDYVDNNGNVDHEYLRTFITYKLVVKNESTNLISQVALRNYADEKYFRIESAKIVNENGNDDITGAWQKGTTNNGITIWETGIIDKDIAPGESITIQLQYELKPEAIASMANLEQEGILDLQQNTTEIVAYSTWDKDNRKQYAGIDQDSAPNNISYGNINTYEDDTDAAPRLQIKRKPEDEANKKISGIVFEDSINGDYKRDDLMTDQERIGNGQYDDGENGIKDVKVELRTYNGNKPVKLYTLDGVNVKIEEANSITNDEGKYTFVGLIPGEYYLKYTYGKFEDKQTIIKNASGDIPVTTENYKSTIVDSGRFRTLLDDINNGNPSGGIDKNNNLAYWYDHIKGSGDSKVSSAVDDVNKREDISKELTTINYKTETDYQEGNIENKELYYMNAYSGVMSFAIEDTNNQETRNENKGYENGPRNYDVKFGIIERPRQSLQVTKEISNMSLTLANGHVLAQGDPRNDTINYVTYPDGNRLKIEIDSELIQGSNLKLTYEIKVYNRSERDYDGTEYYRYGNKGDKYPIDLSYVIADYADENLTFNDYRNPDVNVEDYDFTGMTGKDKWQLLGKDWNLASLGKDLAGIPIWNEVYDSIKTRNNILIKNSGVSIRPGEESTLYLFGTKLLQSMTDKDTVFDNHVELIQVNNPIGRFYGNTYTTDGTEKIVNRKFIGKLTNPTEETIWGATKKGTWQVETPGNYNLTKVGDTSLKDEGDNNSYVRAQTTIVPPLGEVNIAIYVAVGFGSLLILAGGIILIKKKVLR